jgi:predicted RNA binding protein YcfA (HicA-like mRNA interferase family)
VTKRLKGHEREFAEINHREALSSYPGKSSHLWKMFPYAFAGIARRVSRVNYVIHRSSPLFDRLPVDLRYLPYGDIVRKLKTLANVEFVRQEGSHQVWRTPAGKNVVIPRHRGDFRKGTLASIIKQAGLSMSIEEFARA